MRSSFIALALSAMIATPIASPAFAEDFTIFAAASLKTALDEVAGEWEKTTGDKVTISYAGSGQLAKQIQQGAPADLFISAAVNWMDEVEKSGHIDASSRKDLLGNTLVLVGHGEGKTLDLATLPEALGDGKLAMGLLESVPAGQYGQQALEKLGLWDRVESHVAQADNVRAALTLVATGEAPFGIVYGSDAVAEKGVSVAATFPADSHDPIIYPAALVAGSTSTQVGAFFESLQQEPAKSVLEGQGFTVLP